MNSFDFNFFQKYTPAGQTIQHIVHAHPIVIIGKISLWLFFGVFIPVFFYYYSFRIKGFVPFYYLEGWLVAMYIKIIYDIFDWYNDVWIITDGGVIDLDWSLLNTNMSTIDFQNVEGMEVEQKGLFDKILSKGDVVIHKIGEDGFILPDCFHPYAALNQVENIKNHHEEQQQELKPEEEHVDRFDMIMDTLGGVVENYLQNHGKNEEFDFEAQKKAEKIAKYEESQNSIDLR